MPPVDASPLLLAMRFKSSARVPAGLGAEYHAEIVAALKLGVARGLDELNSALRFESTRGTLNARTGTLSRSWVPIPPKETAEGTVSGGFFSRVPYAAIHEYGGVVKPVKAKALTIPMGANTDGVTTPRFPTVALLKSQFGAANVFSMRKSGGGDALLMAKTGKTARSVKAFFVLKKSVKIPARHYITTAVEASSDRVSAQIAKALATAGKGE